VTHTILVAFDVQGETEDAAALALVDMLVAARLTTSHRAEDGAVADTALGPVECWWTPNNPAADGNDMDYKAVLVPRSVSDDFIDMAVTEYLEGRQ